MSSRSALPLLGLALAIVCGGLLWQTWRSDRATSNAASATAVTATPAATPAPQPEPVTDTQIETPAGLSPEAQALLAKLRAVLNSRLMRRGESVLTFKDDAALQRFLARAGRNGVSVIGSVPALRAVRVGIDDLRAFARDLAENAGDYDDLSGNALVTIPLPPAKEDRAAIDQVPFRNRTLEFIGASGDRGTWGRGTTLAIIDTGVASDATFGAGRLRALDIGFGTAPGNGEHDGHGTAIAALAAGLATDAAGVAPAANLLSIRVTDASGVSDIFTISQAIVAAVDAGAQIVNVSLGGYATSRALDAALSYAADHGAVVVAAAGNDQAAQLAWPAADPRVISVGAVDAAGQQVTFSNSGAQLQLSAPGYGVQTAWLNDNRVYMDGTSASSPLVAGAIAAVMSQNPSLTAAQAGALLIASASDAGLPGDDPAYGHGILNVAWALHRNDAGYTDTAIAGQSFDPASGQMQVVVQNRSGRAVTGMTLSVNNGGTTTTQTVPSLGVGEIYVANVPVNLTTARTAGTVEFSTQLNNPLGATDQQPANNRRTSVLTRTSGK